MIQFAIFIIGVIVLIGVTPVFAIVGFGVAWRPPEERGLVSRGVVAQVLGRVLCTFPTTIVPVSMYFLYVLISAPDHRSLGSNYRSYLLVGDGAASLLPLFLCANLVIAVAIIFQPRRILVLTTYVSLVVCVLICISMVLHVIFVQNDGAFVFPFSAGVGYTSGLYFFKHSVGRPALGWPSVPVLLAWILAGVLSVLEAVARARAMLEELPEESPQGCFVVTAAARRGEFGQLETFRAFECWMKSSLPQTHRRMRASYNVVGPSVAGRIRGRWLADVAYFGLKPVEWMLRLSLPKRD